MTISFVGAANAAATTITLPAGRAVADLEIIWAYNNGSNTVPTVPAGWTTIRSAGASTNAGVCAYRVCTSTSDASGTWTNATNLICAVYRGALLASNSAVAATGSSNSIAYPTCPMTYTDGSSWVVGVAGHRTANNVNVAPTGMTNRTSSGTGPQSALHDTAGGVGAFNAASVTVSASSGWVVDTVELSSAAINVVEAGGAGDNFSSQTVSAAHIVEFSTPASQLLPVLLFPATSGGGAQDSPILTGDVENVSSAEAAAAADVTDATIVPGGGTTYSVNVNELSSFASGAIGLVTIFVPASLSPSTYGDVTSSLIPTSVNVTEAGAAADTTNRTAIFGPNPTQENGSAVDVTDATVVTATQSVTEAGAAADTTNALTLIARTVTEAGAAVDAPASLAVLPSTIAEVGAAVDAPNSVGVFPTQAIVEAGAAVDTTNDLAAILRPAVAEVGAAVDVTSNLTSALNATAEAAAAIDVTNNIAALPSALSDFGIATDTTNDASVLACSVAEAGAAIEATNPVEIEVGAIVEAGAAIDQSANIASLPSSVAETGAAADITSLFASGVLVVAEAGSAADAPVTTATLPAAVAEAGAAVDTVISALAAKSAVAEAGAAVDTTTLAGGGVMVVTEAGVAADATTALAILPSALIEAGAAADASTVSVTTVGVIIEAGAAADTVSLVSGVILIVAELGAAVDATDTVAIGAGATTEVGAASDVTNTQVAAVGLMAEMAFASDGLGGGGGTSLTAEHLAAQDVTSASAQTFTSVVYELANAAEFTDASMAGKYGDQTLETGSVVEATSEVSMAGFTVVEAGSAVDIALTILIPRVIAVTASVAPIAEGEASVSAVEVATASVGPGGR